MKSDNKEGIYIKDCTYKFVNNKKICVKKVLKY